MVITNIIGGLGNQMFQYAAGRALSLKCRSNLQLDISDFANYELHQGFELQRIFNCPIDIAIETDLRSVLGWQSLSLVRRVILRRSMAKFRCKEFVVEPHFQYWSGINNLTEDCYLYGYWQTEKYFATVIEQIQKDFTFKMPMESKNSELAKQINQVNAVSLHVRRGDYVNNPKNIAMHGICSIEYYMAAIQLIVEHVVRPHFFIFSDDIAWVKENLKIDYPHQYVDHNYGAESYNDMRLMSLCNYHIIANSSFSWWGAWLNSNTDKVVVAPKHWFVKDINTEDLIPSDWIRL